MTKCSSDCYWSDNTKFCSMLEKASVPMDRKWPLLILTLRSIKDDLFLSEIQKSKMQEVLVRTLQEKDFTDERYLKIASEMQAIVRAPYDSKISEILREASALTEEVRCVLGKHHKQVSSVADTMDVQLADGVEPSKILSGLRDALRDMAQKMVEDTAHLTELSHKDSLTGLANRRAFDEFLNEAIACWQEKGESVALIIFDIDHFKQFNDTYGHLVGDQVLRMLASKLRKTVQRLETQGGNLLAARYGGEEFAVILRGPLADRRREIGEGVRLDIESSTLILRDCKDNVVESGLRVTASIGISPLWSGWNGAWASSLVDCADKALYHAKRSGRNRTVEYTPEETQTYTMVPVKDA